MPQSYAQVAAKGTPAETPAEALSKNMSNFPPLDHMEHSDLPQAEGQVEENQVGEISEPRSPLSVVLEDRCTSPVEEATLGVLTKSMENLGNEEVASREIGERPSIPPQQSNEPEANSNGEVVSLNNSGPVATLHYGNGHNPLSKKEEKAILRQKSKQKRVVLKAKKPKPIKLSLLPVTSIQNLPSQPGSNVNINTDPLYFHPDKCVSSSVPPVQPGPTLSHTNISAQIGQTNIQTVQSDLNVTVLAEQPNPINCVSHHDTQNIVQPCTHQPKQAPPRWDCVFCDSQNHSSFKCELNFTERMGALSKKGRCYKCLNHHKTAVCQVDDTCKHCKKYVHHKLVCEDLYFSERFKREAAKRPEFSRKRGSNTGSYNAPAKQRSVGHNPRSFTNSQSHSLIPTTVLTQQPVRQSLSQHLGANYPNLSNMPGPSWASAPPGFPVQAPPAYQQISNPSQGPNSNFYVGRFTNPPPQPEVPQNSSATSFLSQDIVNNTLAEIFKSLAEKMSGPKKQ